jgi:hypothetical protein
MNSDGLNTHLLASPDDATRDLAAIRDQDFFELARIKSHNYSATIRHKKHK